MEMLSYKAHGPTLICLDNFSFINTVYTVTSWKYCAFMKSSLHNLEIYVTGLLRYSKNIDAIGNLNLLQFFRWSCMTVTSMEKFIKLTYLPTWARDKNLSIGKLKLIIMRCLMTEDFKDGRVGGRRDGRTDGRTWCWAGQFMPSHFGSLNSQQMNCDSSISSRPFVCTFICADAVIID